MASFASDIAACCVAHILRTTSSVTCILRRYSVSSSSRILAWLAQFQPLLPCCAFDLQRPSLIPTTFPAFPACARPPPCSSSPSAGFPTAAMALENIWLDFDIVPLRMYLRRIDVVLEASVEAMTMLPSDCTPRTYVPTRRLGGRIYIAIPQSNWPWSITSRAQRFPLGSADRSPDLGLTIPARPLTSCTPHSPRTPSKTPSYLTSSAAPLSSTCMRRRGILLALCDPQSSLTCLSVGTLRCAAPSLVFLEFPRREWYSFRYLSDTTRTAATSFIPIAPERNFFRFSPNDSPLSARRATEPLHELIPHQLSGTTSY
ncbi:hypothetical protein C8R45DRAFT_1108464 [Mycena sanguinolenta]|nr:hypothetical protein C8R45DRAFT_1108464 [Mycena sanguinolenta]